jgi:hypothetical protein
MTKVKKQESQITANLISDIIQKLIQTTAEAVLGIPHRAQTHNEAKSKSQDQKHKYTPTHPSPPPVIELAKQIKRPQRQTPPPTQSQARKQEE